MPAPTTFQKNLRVHTPTVIQMEAVECGAAALTIILGYYGRHVSLEELRVVCNVSRDGVKASNILRAARTYGLEGEGYKKELDQVVGMPLPMIAFWNFNHFLVIEGFAQDKVYLNDPTGGPRTVTWEEFDRSFTGVVLTFTKTETFQGGQYKPTLWDLLATRLRGAGVALTFIVLVSLMLIIPSMMLPAFTRVFIDDILIAQTPRVTELLLAMLLTVIALLTLAWLQQRYLLRLETRFSLKNSAEYFWHVLRMPMDFFIQRYAGDIAARVALNDEVAMLLSRDLATTLISLILVGFYGLLMIQYSLPLTIITGLIALLNLISLQYISHRRKNANQRLLQHQGKLIGTTMNGLNNIESLKSRGNEAILFTQIAGYHAKAINAEQQFKLLSQVLAAIPPTLTMLTTTIVLVFGSLQVMNGSMTVGMLMGFYSLMGAFLLPINNLVGLGSKLQQIEGGLNRLEDVLRYPEDKAMQNENLPLEDAAVRLHGTLELKNITFGYNKLSPPLIKDFSLTLKPGDRVALVGSSGSGKSTVAKLITGLFEPWEGEILFDGKPRQAIPHAVLTHSLAMVDQDIFLFEGTVRENLTLWDDTIDQGRVVAAARDAQIHDVISTRVGGYESQVEEGGRNFSGGQRQRLEIARALVMNPVILVLDEATSALDTLTEQTIDENLRKRGCTMVIVAHRLSTIRDADEIIVLEEGKIVQRGTHEQLYHQIGAYRSLISADNSESDNDPMQSIFSRLE